MQACKPIQQLFKEKKKIKLRLFFNQLISFHPTLTVTPSSEKSKAQTPKNKNKNNPQISPPIRHEFQN